MIKAPEEEEEFLPACIQAALHLFAVCALQQRLCIRRQKYNGLQATFIIGLQAHPLHFVL
jgi:hypothetical protein